MNFTFIVGEAWPRKTCMAHPTSGVLRRPCMCAIQVELRSINILFDQNAISLVNSNQRQQLGRENFTDLYYNSVSNDCVHADSSESFDSPSVPA